MRKAKIAFAARKAAAAKLHKAQKAAKKVARLARREAQ